MPGSSGGTDLVDILHQQPPGPAGALVVCLGGPRDSPARPYAWPASGLNPARPSAARRGEPRDAPVAASWLIR
jgi:hypothetical protein